MSPAEAAAADSQTVLAGLGSGPDGLSSAEAQRRLAEQGPNAIGAQSRSLTKIFTAQARNGINLLLAGAGVLTIATGDLVDGAIILILIALNVGLSIVQEYRAELALEALRNLLPVRARVVRDGKEIAIPADQLVPGDIVLIFSGDLVPADIRLLECRTLQVNQATLTGESVAQEKTTEPVSSTKPVDWRDMAFAGTTAVGGVGKGVVVATGARTQFGQTAALVQGAHARSDFEKNLTNFGSFLLRFGLLLAAGIFISNALLHGDVVASLTLALAVALGVVPEALPAVTATTLALGARSLARKKVLVRRLAAIEDFSAIDTLCSDKTGTITENRTQLVDSWSLISREKLLEAALLCSSYPQRGVNVIDDALIDAASVLDLDALKNRRRQIVTEFSPETKQMCVSVEDELIFKGAATSLIQRCRRLRTPDGDQPLDDNRRVGATGQIDRMQADGARVIAVAAAPAGTSADGAELTLLGLLAMSDPPRPGAAQALREAERFGVEVKIVTGDARARAAALARQIGMDVPEDAIVAADELQGRDIGEAALRGRIFAEVVPADKFHLVQALQHQGRHVAVTGDGVNDAPALQAADVGIALASGTDATKGAADMVLLEDNLQVIIDGIQEGRRTFTNINRYLLYTMVSNFANVVIVAVASLVLPFLPLLPSQVLLLNVLADLPMLAIVTDKVATEDIATPRRWDVRRLVELSIFLGVVNAILAFGLLRFFQGRTAQDVHAAWFLFLGSTALFILFAVRTRGWFYSRPWPSVPVLAALGAAFVVTVALVNIPEAKTLLRFGNLSLTEQVGIEAYSLIYLLVADLLQHAFRRTHPTAPGGRRAA
ncbi:MAG TPA: cation-transporting P-type ATPase [Candidatus Sulfotelmatobacter sp.]|nr:cation-transporting P-type ATPase [Candidatus Sulfotelmatobacter sp.]